MQLEDPKLYGITKYDIQAIFEETLRNFKQSKTRIIYLDASYLYNLDLDDFEIVKKFNILGRYDLEAVKEWHRILERWYQDQTVILGDKTIKPIKVVRSFDRVVNEALESIAGSVCGQSCTSYPFRSIGDGDITDVTPNDRILANEIDRINVNENPEGGSLSRDGATIYSIGNHDKALPSADVTECGMQSTDSPTTDLMFDHSMFAEAIEHVQNADAVGSTTIIYQCSS